jgi:sterol desaturase/sphingolipid hydroxylase (fatty acid hydroxylase superfamily)
LFLEGANVMFGLFDYFLFAFFGVIALLDFISPARAFPKVRFWRLKGFAFAVLYFVVAGYSPFLWDEWLGQYRMVDATGLNLAAAVAIGFVTLQLGIYVWHRTMHNVNFLWRHSHQMHHSAERVDVWGALYFHPFDMLGFTFVGSLMLVMFVGISAEAAAIVNLLAAFCSVFQHANVKTPWLLGFFVTRPESHSLHHQRDVHAYNYGDIPLWDMVFGTFRNPKTWNEQAGFYDGASSQMADLLVGRDISGVDNAQTEPAPQHT